MKYAATHITLRFGMLRVNMRASVWIKNSKRYLTECRLRNKSYFDSGLKVNIVYVNNIDRCIIEGKSKKKKRYKSERLFYEEIK